MKREHGILIPVMRYCYLLMSVIRALDPPPPLSLPPSTKVHGDGYEICKNMSSIGHVSSGQNETARPIC